jgi:hypothetical protein
MGRKRTVWHLGFGRLLAKRGPRGFTVLDEVPLSKESPRMDFLLLRRTRRLAPGDRGETLRGLWKLLPAVSVVEYKSAGRPYRKGDLDRLLGYTHLYQAYNRGRGPLRKRADLGAVLVVPRCTPSLQTEAKEMGLAWADLGGGYFRLEGAAFGLHVVETVVVADAERDDVLRSFGDPEVITQGARRFWAEVLGSQEAGMAMQDLEGYDELMKKLLASMPPEQVLAAYAPEQRVAGLPPEKRLAGLTEAQAVLALPNAMLRALSDEYLATLPKATRAAIQRRLGRAASSPKPHAESRRRRRA